MVAKRVGGLLLGLALWACGEAGAPPDDARQPSSDSADAPTAPDAPGSSKTTTTTAPGPRKTDLFVKTFGRNTDPPVLFLHGGPGGNSIMFEVGIAEDLAARGNYVVTFDQRGGGRSPKGTEADFSFAKATQDVDDVIATQGLKDPVLVAHSFGGTLAVKYLELHPEGAKGAVLVANPMDYPDSVFNVLEGCEAAYRRRFSTEKANHMAELKASMFPNGLTPPYTFPAEKFGEVISQATSCGLTLPTIPSPGSLVKWAGILKNEKDAMKAEDAVGNGFHKNERLLHQNFEGLFGQLKPKLRAIYGADDGLVSVSQQGRIPGALGADHFVLIPNAGHVIWIDQHDAFLEQLTTDLAALRSQ